MAVPVYSVGQVLGAADCNNWFLPVAAYRTTTQSVTSSATLVNDNQLSVAVSANAVYKFDLEMLYDGDVSGDLKLGWTFPTGAVLSSAYSSGLIVGAGSSSDDFTGASSTNPAYGCIGAGTTCALRYSFLLTVSSTAGTLQLQWAQNNAFGTATRVFAGSSLIGRRVG